MSATLAPGLVVRLCERGSEVPPAHIASSPAPVIQSYVNLFKSRITYDM
jgi:hypothetical protein